MLLQDRLAVVDAGRSQDGYRKVRARSARAGVYDYLGVEVDPEGKRFKPNDVVKVYRPADEVFDKASLASFALKPITDDHPAVAVTAANWRDHARGTIVGAVKDGEYVGFDLAFMDADTVSKLDSGKRELSNGYSCDLSFEDGTAPDGTAYQAIQRNIRGNHVALVDRGRAGPECRVNDDGGSAFVRPFALCDANPDALATLDNHKEKQMKKIVLDGLQVDLSDADAVSAAFDKLQAKVATAEKALADATSAHDKALAAKDTEIDKLKERVVDQAKIDALADAKAEVVAKGKALLGDKLPETKGKTVADVRRAIVAAKLGDAAITDKSDDYVEARFDGLTADVKTEDAKVHSIGAPRIVANDGAAIRDAALAARNRFASQGN